MTRPISMQTARIGQALASPVRLRALNLLAQRAWPVGALAAELGESPAATSAHLKVLRSACLVESERRGREVRCRVASDEVVRLLVAAREAAEALLPELGDVVREAGEDPSSLAAMGPRELAAELRANRVVVVDLRPPEEFAAGHVPGARSIPADTLDGLDAAGLPPELRGEDARVAAYCRGPWCVRARTGTRALNEAGVPARRLPFGIVEWRAAGLELEAPPGRGVTPEAGPPEKPDRSEQP